MNFRSFDIGETSVRITANNGDSLSVSYADIKAQYDAASGSVNVRKGAVLQWALDLWEARFGVAIFPRGWMTGDFDPATGRVLFITCKAV